MSVNIKWYSFQHLYPPPNLTSHYPPDILDSISRKSNRLRLKFVTKGNGKDVLKGAITGGDVADLARITGVEWTML